MYQAYQTSLEDEILSADPLELVCMLYSGALTSLKHAREALAQGDPMRRGAAIAKVQDLLMELVCSLNHERGGDISRGLADLYQYFLQRLVEAHAEQSDTKLAEIERLMATLLEGWRAAIPARQAEFDHSEPIALNG